MTADDVMLLPGPRGIIGTGVAIQIVAQSTDIQFHRNGDAVYAHSLRHGTAAIDELLAREARGAHQAAVGEAELSRARPVVLSGAGGDLTLAGRDLGTGFRRTITLRSTGLRAIRALWIAPFEKRSLSLANALLPSPRSSAARSPAS